MNPRNKTKLDKELAIIADWCRGILIKIIAGRYKVAVSTIYSILDRHGYSSHAGNKTHQLELPW